MKKILMIFIVLGFVFLGCTTAPSSGGTGGGERGYGEVLPPETAGQLSSIDKWCIGFKYTNSTVETKIMSDGTEERVFTDYGQPNLNLELLDHIIFTARTEYGTILRRDVDGGDREEDEGKILLHWVISDFGKVFLQDEFSLRIFFYDPEGELIHEAVLIKDKYFNPPPLYDVMDKYILFIMEAIGRS